MSTNAPKPDDLLDAEGKAIVALMKENPGLSMDDARYLLRRRSEAALRGNPDAWGPGWEDHGGGVRSYFTQGRPQASAAADPPRRLAPPTHAPAPAVPTARATVTPESLAYARKLLGKEQPR